MWLYLKDVVSHENPISVEDLVEKLMNAVTVIPQPLLKSVVKAELKKQQSQDEGGKSKAFRAS